MKEIGQSSLYVERYRPKFLEDYICTDEVRTLIRSVIDSKQVPCFLFHGTGGVGKTSLANVIANELDCDLLYMNGSLETSIDNIRFKVTQFVMTSSLMGNDIKKLVVIDELDRMSVAACESLKCIVEQCESNARFIFCTNNLQKIIQPLQSRSQVIHFGNEKTKPLIMATYKRLCFILDNEKVTYDKKVLAEITQKTFPDIRKLINEVQKYSQMYGCIDERILSASDDSKVEELVAEMKAKKFNNVRKICNDIDPENFMNHFYEMLDEHIKDSAKPDIVLLIGEYGRNHYNALNKTIDLVCLCTEIMRRGDIWR